MSLFRASRTIATRAFQAKPVTRYSFAPFSSTTAAMRTISDAITEDHRELDEYFQNIVKSTDTDTQTRYQNQFVWELARHSVAEELVVYPAMEKYLGAEGKAKADHDRKEHHKVKEQLKKFQNLSATDPDFLPTLKNLMADLLEHIEDEERDDLPKLEKALQSPETAKDSDELATSFERTKMFVPSRSHPSAGENPPFETAMGLLVAPFDHIADMFRKFPNKTVSPNPSTK